MAIPNLSASAETFMATVILIRGGRVMKKLFYFAAFAACVLTSCQQVLDIQEKEEDIKTPGLVFTATTESSATKTALEEDSGNYNVAWRSGDEITIVDAAATPNVGVYSTGSNTTSADFTFDSGKKASTAPFKAWYPASIYNNGAPTLPATQEYVEGNIAGSPMFASSSTTSLKFKNLAGIICLNLSTGMADISVASIALSATQPMSGPISNAESLSSDTPVAATVSGSAGVTLDCGAGVAINSTPKPFYFAVPAGSYTGLAITVTTTGGAYQTFTLKADRTIVVERSRITDINLTANNILYDLPASYSPAEYLASDGTQYIDTGVPCDWQDFVDIDFMYTGTEPGNVHPSEGGSVFGAHGWSKANGIYEKCIYWRGFGKIAYNFAIGTRYNVKTVDGTHSSINGVTYQIDDTGSVGVAPSNFALFANYSDYNNQGWTYFSVARIYSCKLYDSNHVWLRYFVPCVRTSDGKPGMYDRVNDVFYVNQGTGEFNNSVSNATDLSATATANSYIVPAAGTYKFNATVKGNGYADLADISKNTDASSIASAELFWATFGTSTAPAENELIKDIFYQNGYVYFSTGDTFKEGNALIAVKDASDNILWSWHIWVHNYDESYLTGSNNVKMMNRNLGALSTSVSSTLSYGMYYQWGRKDPFIGTPDAVSGTARAVVDATGAGGVTVEESILHPANYYVLNINTANRWEKGDHWCSDATTRMTLWAESAKTIFDPCPPGWRVPSHSEVTGMGITFNAAAGFAPSGYIETFGAPTDTGGNGGAGTLWKTTNNGTNAGIEVVYGLFNSGLYRSPDMGFNVRCVKE